jgi:PAS domain S-box-containing protein
MPANAVASPSSAQLEARIAELERGAALLEPILAAMPLVVVRFDHAYRITYVSRYLPQLSPQQVLGRPVYDFIDPAFHEIAGSTIAAVLATGTPGAYENTGPGPNGTLAHYQTQVAAVREADGTVGGCLVATDVTALKQRERELAEREQALQLAIAATRVGLFSWDLTTNVVTWDRRMYEITGLDEPLPLDQYVSRLVHPDDRAAVLSEQQRFDAGEAFGKSHRIVRRDGSERWILSMGRTITDGSGRPIRLVGGLLDVTEQRQLEEQLFRSQRLNAIGTLTAGVAHNFNNLLMVVLPNLELLSRAVPATHAQALADCIDAAQRAADLVRKLMTYAGKRPRRRASSCEVGPLVERLISMCTNTFDPRVRLEAHVAPGLPPVKADATDVEQVLMNLIVNARDAVLASGRPSGLVDVRAVREGDAVVVTVRDDGVGMDSTTLARACEPFFTTKGIHAGSGLGLATSSSIATELGGRLTLESEPGRGTLVTLSLPLGEALVDRERAREVERPGQVRVLVVDDEPMVRSVVARLLAQQGHEVHEAADAKQAVVEASAHPCDVVLLDRSLLQGSGESLISRLRETSPRVRVLFFTGHDLTPAEVALVDGVIQKPVRMDELTARIAQSARTG